MNKRKIIWKSTCSVVSAIVLTALFCMVYTVCRNILLDAIENHSIAFLEKFDLIGKIKVKCHYDTIPTIWQLQNQFMQIAKFFLFALGLCVLLFFMPLKSWHKEYKFKWLPSCQCIIGKVNAIKSWYLKANKKWLAAIILLFACQYALCYSIIDLSWFSGDDYYCAMTTGKSFIVKFSWWIWCCLTHVARVFESIYYYFPLSLDRWQHLLVTPLVFSLFPLIVMRLATPKVKVCSLRGATFYLMLSCLIYLGLARFSTFCCYAPCTGYIYSTIFVMAMAPFWLYYDGSHKDHSILEIFIFTILSFIVGTSTEGIAAIFSLLLASQWLYCMYKGKHMTPIYYWSLIGFWIGATWILFVPGSSIRGMNTAFTGGNVPYNLYGMTLFEKLTFVPEMCRHIWKLIHCEVYVILALALLWVYAYNKGNAFHRQELKHSMKTTLLIIVLGLSLAFIYLAGAIPNGSTLTPCSLTMICAITYMANALWQNGFFKEVMLVVVGVLISAVIYIYPAITYAHYLKPYEKIRTENIYRQKAEGKMDIVLPYRFPTDYDSIRSKLPDGFGIEGRPEVYGVKSIKEKDTK